MSAFTDFDQEQQSNLPPPDSPSSSNSSQDHLLGAYTEQRSIKMMQRSDSYKSKKDGSAGEGVGEDQLEPGTRNAAGGQLWTYVAPVPDTDRISRDSDLNLSDLFDPQRTAKENKSILMSYELDRMEMGKYQWFIFGLCGLGYFIDLLWAQADRKSTRLNSSHSGESRMPSSA